MNFWGPEQTHTFGIVTERFKYLHWYYAGEGMKPTEELYDLSKDRLELKNRAADAASASDLESLQTIYDLVVSSIKTEARTPHYAKYATLFDRTTPWPAKESLLPKKRTPAGK